MELMYQDWWQNIRPPRLTFLCCGVITIFWQSDDYTHLYSLFGYKNITTIFNAQKPGETYTLVNWVTNASFNILSAACLASSHYLIPSRLVHYSDVIMGVMASQITGLTSVYSNVYSGADQRKHQSSASLAFVRGIHWWPVNSPHKWPVTRKMFPFDDVIMCQFDLLKNIQWYSNKNHKKINLESLFANIACTMTAICSDPYILNLSIRFFNRHFFKNIHLVL